MREKTGSVSDTGKGENIRWCTWERGKGGKKRGGEAESETGTERPSQTYRQTNRQRLRNKAVYTTAPVAGGWAGAISWAGAEMSWAGA